MEDKKNTSASRSPLGSLPRTRLVLLFSWRLRLGKNVSTWGVSLSVRQAVRLGNGGFLFSTQEALPNLFLGRPASASGAGGDPGRGTKYTSFGAKDDSHAPRPSHKPEWGGRGDSFSALGRDLGRYSGR